MSTLAFAGERDLLEALLLGLSTPAFTGDRDLLDTLISGLASSSFFGEALTRLKAKAVAAVFDALLTGLLDCALVEPVLYTLELMAALELDVVLLRPRTGLADGPRAVEEDRSLEFASGSSIDFLMPFAVAFVTFCEAAFRPEAVFDTAVVVLVFAGLRFFGLSVHSLPISRAGASGRSGGVSDLVSEEILLSLGVLVLLLGGTNFVAFFGRPRLGDDGGSVFALGGAFSFGDGDFVTFRAVTVFVALFAEVLATAVAFVLGVRFETSVVTVS